MDKNFSVGGDVNNSVFIKLTNVRTISDVRYELKKLLNQHNWATTTYNVPITALLISKHTNLRLLIFGSQASGKTSCITAVYHDAFEDPRILFDLHRKNLYEYVNMVKNVVKVIEQQYRHDWAREDTKLFDNYEVVPISKIAPSELLFRFYL